jgi:hypothetical protein
MTANQALHHDEYNRHTCLSGGERWSTIEIAASLGTCAVGFGRVDSLCAKA